MLEIDEIAGTRILRYKNIEDFVDAIKREKPERVYTYLDEELFNDSLTASFVDNEGIVRIYANLDHDNYKEDEQSIRSLLGESDIPEVNGVINVSQKDGDIYHFFKSIDSDIEAEVKRSYDSWFYAVRDLPFQRTLIQYLVEGSNVSIDAKYQRNHLVIAFDQRSGITLEDTLNKLQSSVKDVLGKPYRIIDKTPDVNWHLEIKKY